MSEEQHSVKTQRDQGMEELLANLAGADISNALTMPNSVAIEFHPYSRLFPLMEGCELAGLVADIQENGLRVPIGTAGQPDPRRSQPLPGLHGGRHQAGFRTVYRR